MNLTDSIQAVINTLNLIEVKGEDNLLHLSASIRVLRHIQQEIIEQGKAQKGKAEEQNDDRHDK
jgi:hypothetical protein